MLQIDIQAIPNQTFTTILDDSLYEISINEGNGIMAMSITRDGISVIENQRLVADEVAIPYEYLEKGNFILTTANGDLPSYEQFGITQLLFYYSQAELDEARA